MLGFLLHGDWMRGVNLFCLCSILLVISVAYPINLASSVLLNVSGDLVAGQGVTLCRLLYSCIKYITVIGVIYFSLEYLGFSTGTILASLGVVSLALSLGAQDLIADILAGLAIVFDDCFRVGDVVEINGTKGTVIEIGVRSTKLRADGNNILIVNNHEITGILNMSKELTELTMEIRVPASRSLSSMEELLARELPAIGQKNPKLTSGPYLLGLSEMGGSDPNTGTLLLSLTVGAMFNQKDSSAVRYFLNRELRLLFDREGIDLM
jgi:small conductance mechanosensitive channel